MGITDTEMQAISRFLLDCQDAARKWDGPAGGVETEIEILEEAGKGDQE